MSKRYFLDTDTKDGRSLKPGEISNELRFALGIQPDKLPIWIYRMRALGYPPGWLKKAQVSSLELFDSDKSSPDGCANRSRGPDLDDGEIVDQTIVDQQYDHSSLIVYPGFNAPMPEGVVDCHYYLGMPSMMPHQQLDYAKIHLRTPKPLPKSKRIRTSNEQSTESPDTTFTQNVSESTNDKDTDASSTPTTTKSNPSGSSAPEDSPVASRTKPKIETTPSGTLKMVTMSHPMPTNPEKPSLEKFSEGMSDLLYFTNLPNYTGIFDRVRKVLQNARNKKDVNIDETVKTEKED